MKTKIAASLLFVATTALAQGPAPIASQGTASVTFADVDARAASIPEAQRHQVFDNPQRIEAIVTSLLVNRQLANEAIESGLDKTAEAQNQIRIARESVLAKLRTEQIRREAKVDAESIAREVYQVNPAAHALPEQREVRHMLFETTSAGELAAQTKLKRAQEALAKGESFADVARRLSDDTGTAPNGGLLPKFPRGRMEGGFEEAAFALTKPGSRSNTVRTSYGYHLIELVSIEPPKSRSFEEVKAELVAKIRAEQVEGKVKEHVDRLKNNKVEADPDAIASLRTRYAPKDAAGNPIVPTGPEAAAEPKAEAVETSDAGQ